MRLLTYRTAVIRRSSSAAAELVAERRARSSPRLLRRSGRRSRRNLPQPKRFADTSRLSSAAGRLMETSWPASTYDISGYRERLPLLRSVPTAIASSSTTTTAADGLYALVVAAAAAVAAGNGTPIGEGGGGGGAAAAVSAESGVDWSATEAALHPQAADETHVAVTVLKGAVMALITLATLLGNVMVIVSVCKFRYLRVMNNYFIVSLAVADLLVGSVVMPFNMYNQLVSLRWQFGRVVCDIFNANDVLFTTASVLHLGFISVDRYMAIMNPFSYERRMSRRRVFFMLALAWTLSALLSYGPVFSGIYTTAEHLDEIRADPQLCDFKVSVPYAFVSSSISFWMPCITMIVTYQKILREAMAQERHIRSLMVYTARDDDGGGCGGGGGSRASPSAAIANGCGGGSGGAADGSNNCDDDEDYDDVEVTSTAAGRRGGDCGKRSGSGGAGGGGSGGGGSSSAVSASISHALRALLRRDSKQARKLRREHRAAKTLGLIMGVFILCYLPFFTWYTLSFGICPGQCALKEAYVSVLFWLGYANSCANPIVYAFYNKDFQVAFRKLLCSRGLSNVKKFSVSDDGAAAGTDGGGAASSAAATHAAAAERRSGTPEWPASP